jgi:riboflavin synthase
MFTGIIETLGKITKIDQSGTNKSFWVNSLLTKELNVDQSVSHNGVCLTVEEIRNDDYKVTAIHETLQKTNLDNLAIGDMVNLERCVSVNGRFDGHFVSGHVDTTAICSSIKDQRGSWEYEFVFEEQYASFIIEKGSICINGISLTLFNITNTSFMVAIIPYTYEHTNMKLLQVNDKVNIEFDMIGKFVNRIESLKTMVKN